MSKEHYYSLVIVFMTVMTMQDSLRYHKMWPFPDFRMMSLYTTAFQQSLEFVDQKPRAEFKCVFSDYETNWVPVDVELIDKLKGTHPFKIYIYMYLMNPTVGKARRDDFVNRYICKKSDLVNISVCEGAKQVRIVNRSIDGSISGDSIHACQ